MELRFLYAKDDESLSCEEFWKEEGGAFDKENKTHVFYMIQAVCEQLQLDEYGVAKLESAIKTELPFFAKTRRIAKEWLMREFIY